MKIFLYLKSLIFIVIYLNSNQTLQSQEISKKKKVGSAYQYYRTTESLFKERDYKNAIFHAKKAKKIYRETQKWDSLILISDLLIESYKGISDLPSLYLEANEVLRNSKNIHSSKRKNLIRATAFTNKSIYHELNGLYDSALFWEHKALAIKIQELESDAKGILNSYSGIGIAHARQGEYDSALFYFLKSIKILENKSPLNSKDLIKFYGNVSNTYFLIKLPSKGKEYLEKSLNLTKKILPKNHPSLAKNYDRIAHIYSTENAFHKATEYQEKSVLIGYEVFGKNHLKNLVPLYNLAYYTNRIGDQKQAYKLYNRALAIANLHFPGKHPKKANILNGIGNIFRFSEQYDSAIYFYKKSLYSVISNDPAYLPTLIKIHENMGGCFHGKGDFHQSIKSYKQSLEAVSKLSENSTNLTVGYRSLAKVFKDMGLYDSALYYIQKALISNSKEFNDSTDYYKNPFINDNYIKKDSYLNLKEKRNILIASEEETYDSICMSISISIDSLIDQIKLEMPSLKDKISFTPSCHEAYQSAVETSYNLFLKSKLEKYKEFVFYFSEKSKAQTISDNLLNQQIINNHNIPNSLIKSEKSLKEKINYYHSKINDKYINKSKSDSIMILHTKNILFELNRKLDSIQNEIKSNYTNYSNTKDQIPFIKTVSQTQNSLPPKSILIEYNLTLDKPIAIVIGKDFSEVIPLPIENNLEGLITQFKTSLTNADRFSTENFKNYTLSAYKLYQKIIAPFEEILKDHKIENLYVIPDGELLYLPLGSLIQSMPVTEQINFQELDYLIKSYNINYQYTASLAFKEKTKKNKSSSGFVGFAPSFSNLTKGIDKKITPRRKLIPLKWNTKEVDNINKSLQGNVFKGELANEVNFKKQAKEAKILHLATHALIDKKEPMNSKIILSQAIDSLQDGIIHAFEIYNMEFNSDLVTLSACNTGYGQFQKGEGIMSLAHAFSYAGIPSLVMSHWEVDDKVTSKLMTYFYENLRKGLSKDQSLRQAKLTLINSDNPVSSNPFFWSAFVVIGDNDPIYENHNALSFTILVIVLILLLVILLIYKRFKTKSNGIVF